MTREKDLPGKYYGPYGNAQSAKVVLQLIRDVYPLRSCRHALDEKGIARGKFSLCLDYHIKKCGGACRGLINPDEYGKFVAQVRQILNGETLVLENYLRDEMTRLSEEWKFEEAQGVKEKYEAVKRYNAKSVIARSEEEADMFAYDENSDSAFVNFMHLHHGAVVQSLNMEFRRRLAETPAEVLSMAIVEISRRFNRRFTSVIVPFEPDVEFEGWSLWCLSAARKKKKILDVGMKNVRQYMTDKEKMAEKLDPEKGVEKLMEQMKKISG